MPEFFIDIEPNGDVTIDGGDHVGPDCETLTKDLEEALGQVTERKKKAEYNRPRQVQRKVNA